VRRRREQRKGRQHAYCAYRVLQHSHGFLRQWLCDGQPNLCQLLAPCKIPTAYASGPFKATPVIREVKLRQIQAVCEGGNTNVAHWAGKGNFLGCAQLTAERCEVHVPIDVKAVSDELFDWYWPMNLPTAVAGSIASSDLGSSPAAPKRRKVQAIQALPLRAV
jgi:hypothetical protein